MKIDYSKIIRNSVEFVWKNKSIWVLGFFSTFLLVVLSYSMTPFQFSAPTGENIDTSRQGLVMLMVCFGLFALLGYIFFTWYVSRRASNAIVLAAHDSKEENLGLRKLWRKSQERILRTMVLDLAIYGVYFIVLMILLMPFIVLAIALNNPAVLLVLCCVFIFIIPLGILVVNVYYTSNYLILTKHQTVSESIKNSYDLFKTHWKKFLVVTLIEYAFATIYGLIVTIPIYMIAIPYTFFVLAVMSLEINVIITFGISAIAGIVMAAVYSAMMAPYMAYALVFRTKFIAELIESN